jgi:hypothetical protein
MKSLLTHYKESYPTTFLLSRMIRNPNTEIELERKAVEFSDLPDRDVEFLKELEIHVADKSIINFRKPLSEIILDYELEDYERYIILQRLNEPHVYFIETEKRGEDFFAKRAVCINNFNVIDESYHKSRINESSIKVPQNLLDYIIKSGMQVFLGDFGFYLKSLVDSGRLPKEYLDWFLVEFGYKYNVVISKRPLKKETFRYLKYAGKEDFYFSGVPYKEDVIRKLQSLPTEGKYFEIRFYKGRLKRDKNRRGIFFHRRGNKGPIYDAIAVHSQELEDYIKILPSLSFDNLVKFLGQWENNFKATCKHELQHWVQYNFLEPLGFNRNKNIDFLPWEQGNPKFWNKAYKRSYIKSEVEFYPQITSAVARYQNQFGKNVTNPNIQKFVNTDPFLKELYAADVNQYKRFLKQFYIALDQELS